MMKSKDQTTSRDNFVLGLPQGLAAIVIGVLTGGIFLWLKKINPLEEKILQMENEKEQLENQLQEVSNLTVLQQTVDHKPFSLQKDWSKRVLSILVVLLSLVGPVMVILHRWLKIEQIGGEVRNFWCRSELLCRTILPPYFLYFFASILGLIILFIVWRPKINIPYHPTFQFPITENEIPERQRKGNYIFGIIISLLLLADIIGVLVFSRIPKFEYIFLIIGYLIYCYLREFRWDQAGEAVKRIPTWPILFIIFVFGLLYLLRSMFEQNVSFIFPLLLMIGSFILLIPHLKKISIVFLISIGGLFLYSIFLGSWRYSVIGDEYSFFNFTRFFLMEHSFIPYTFMNFLNPETAVHGKFVYMSLIPNILSMEMFGTHNFGWRIGNSILCCASIPFFYGFVKRFMNKRMAILFSILVVSSHALLGFSKIGYNNLTALFAMSFLFWLTGKVLEANSVFAYSLLGAAIGISIYSYTAIFAILPLPFLLVFIYTPPFKSKRSMNQWLTMIIVVFLFLVPTLNGSDFWAYIQSESTLASPNIGDRSFHIFSNLIYTFISPFYAPINSHFVTVSFLDAISGSLLIIGLIALVVQLRKNKFARFILISYLFMFISLGISRERSLPNITHFFLYFPIWWIIVVNGIDYLSRLLFFNATKDSRFTIFQVSLMVVLVLVNLTQAYIINPQNSKQYYNHEVLFLRFLMQADKNNQTDRFDYLYLTDDSWNIFGVKDIQLAYQLPADKSQLTRSPMYINDLEPDLQYEAEWVTLPAPFDVADDAELDQIQIESWAFDKLDDPETIIVTHPIPKEDTMPVLIETMAQHHRGICELRADPDDYAHAVLWLDEDWMWMCPKDGIWEVNW